MTLKVQVSYSVLLCCGTSHILFICHQIVLNAVDKISNINLGASLQTESSLCVTSAFSCAVADALAHGLMNASIKNSCRNS